MLLQAQIDLVHQPWRIEHRQRRLAGKPPTGELVELGVDTGEEPLARGAIPSADFIQ